MIERIDYPDGWIELAASGNGNPPDRQGGQHTNSSTLWVRVPGGEFRRVEGYRSRHGARMAAKTFGSVAEAMAGLTGV